MRTITHTGAIEDADAGVDLRRRRRRSDIDALLAMAAHLPPEDAALVRAVFGQGMRASELAAVRHESARAVRRRVRSVAKRALSPRFRVVVRDRGAWGPTRRRVADACVLQGMSMRAAAASQRLTLHSVRRHLDAINALVEQEAR